MIVVSNIESILRNLSFTAQVRYVWKNARVTPTVTEKKFVWMGNASQDASQTINVQEVRNASKINAMTAGACVNMITIVIEAKNVKTGFVKICALGITLVLHQTKNVSLEHVRNLVVTSFVQKDQSVSKAHVILYVVKKTLHVNPFNLFVMRITKSVFQGVGQEDVLFLVKVLSV